MKFIHHNNSIGEIEFPKDLSQWIADYDSRFAPNFYIELMEEMPGDLFGHISCMINREKDIAMLSCSESQYVNFEGNGGYAIREINNIFESKEEIEFRTFEGMKRGWELHKCHLISMKKAISVIEYVTENLSYPDDVRFDKWHDLNREIEENN